ncbi:MAG: MATE family efflux transporter [Mucilaginibacter polytrichastri]|nr:MATE family efflux transporter [Mucilaginibacter polytrichastri]
MLNRFSKYRPHYRSNLRLAVPVVISQLGYTLVHTADSVIVGHFAGNGPEPLAAVSLVNSVITIILMVGIGISYGLTPLVAQESGRKNPEEPGRLLINSLVINIATGIFLFLVAWLGMLLLIDHLDQAPGVVILAKPYLFLLGISLVPLMIFMTFKQFAEGLGYTKQAMQVSIWGNVFNVLLGITFVKGLFGIAPMGVNGVGWSTLIERILMAVVMGAYIFRSKHFTQALQSFTRAGLSWLRSVQILKIGAPVAMQYVFEVSAFSGAAIMIGSIGPTEQAAHLVAINMAAITYMMAGGVSAAASIKTGNNYGAKDYTQLRLSAISSYHIVLIFMSCTALLFIVLNRYLPWIYTSEKPIIAIASQLLLVAALFQLFDGAQVVGLGILRGIGDVNIPTFITFVAYWLVGIPVGYLLGLKLELGVLGVWAGLCLGLLVSGGLLFLRFQKMSKDLLPVQAAPGQGIPG